MNEGVLDRGAPLERHGGHVWVERHARLLHGVLRGFTAIRPGRAMHQHLRRGRITSRPLRELAVSRGRGGVVGNGVDELRVAAGFCLPARPPRLRALAGAPTGRGRDGWCRERGVVQGRLLLTREGHADGLEILATHGILTAPIVAISRRCACGGALLPVRVLLGPALELGGELVAGSGVGVRRQRQALQQLRELWSAQALGAPERLRADALAQEIGATAHLQQRHGARRVGEGLR
mmetsp:Transcript_16481/g.46811  ORF Transcript_16481/g.46811 Transcript_16481/m.46811 type:complete len:236 (-) Transcript_16481:1193-1900(-)